MKRKRFLAGSLAALLFTVCAQAALASGDGLPGLWQYREIITVEAPATETRQEAQGVLLADLESMPLNLLGKVFGKLAYTAEFAENGRFVIDIKVMGMHFHAEGGYTVQDGNATLVYDTITGFEKLWWLGSFDRLTHCDAEHPMTETVAFAVADDTLTFYSSGANAVFTRAVEP